jgi:hypothetical protein
MRAAEHAGWRPFWRRHAVPAAVAITALFVAAARPRRGGGDAGGQLSAAAATAGSFDDAAYWRYADSLQRRLSGMWDPRLAAIARTVAAASRWSTR